MRRSPAPSPHRLIYDAEVHVLIPAHGSTLVPLQQNISKGIVVTVKEIKMTPAKAIQTVDNARIHAAYNDNSPASCATEWLLFNARSIIKAEARGDAVHILCLAESRQKYIRNL